MLTIQDVNGAIMSQTWTDTQLSSMIDAVRFAKARLGQRNKARMMTGDTVSFTSSKSGQTIKGTVTKIAVKYVTVRTALGLYKVPANMLSVVDAETV